MCVWPLYSEVTLDINLVTVKSARDRNLVTISTASITFLRCLGTDLFFHIPIWVETAYIRTLYKQSFRPHLLYMITVKIEWEWRIEWMGMENRTGIAKWFARRASPVFESTWRINVCQSFCELSCPRLGDDKRYSGFVWLIWTGLGNKGTLTLYTNNGSHPHHAAHHP